MSNKFDSGHKLPLGSCRPTGHETLSDVAIFSLSGVEPDIQVQGKFTLFGGARLFSRRVVLVLTSYITVV